VGGVEAGGSTNGGGGRGEREPNRAYSGKTEGKGLCCVQRERREYKSISETTWTMQKGAYHGA